MITGDADVVTRLVKVYTIIQDIGHPKLLSCKQLQTEPLLRDDITILGSNRVCLDIPHISSLVF